MNLKTLKIGLVAITLVLVIIGIFPLVNSLIFGSNDYDAFSEIWLMGPDQNANDLPFDVVADEVYNISVNLANHMGRSEYYLVKVKFRTITQSVHELANSQPSSLNSLYEFRIVLEDETTWDTAVNFSFHDVTQNANSVTVGDVVINGKAFSVDSSATVDSEDGCYYFQLFFELWRYDSVSNDFVFDEQYVGLWFNITASE